MRPERWCGTQSQGRTLPRKGEVKRMSFPGKRRAAHFCESPVPWGLALQGDPKQTCVVAWTALEAVREVGAQVSWARQWQDSGAF